MLNSKKMVEIPVPKDFDCLEAINSLYVWMEKNSKKI